MEKIKRIAIIAALVLGFTLPAFGGEKEDLALRIYLNRATLQIKVQEAQKIKREIDRDEKRLKEILDKSISKLGKKLKKKSNITNQGR